MTHLTFKSIVLDQPNVECGTPVLSPLELQPNSFTGTCLQIMRLNSCIDGVLRHGTVGCPLPTCNHTFTSLFGESKGSMKLVRTRYILYITLSLLDLLQQASHAATDRSSSSDRNVKDYPVTGKVLKKITGEAQQTYTLRELPVPAIVTRPLSLMVTTWFRDIDCVSLELGSVTRGRMPLHAANTSPLLTVRNQRSAKVSQEPMDIYLIPLPRSLGHCLWVDARWEMSIMQHTRHIFGLLKNPQTQNRNPTKPKPPPLPPSTKPSPCLLVLTGQTLYYMLETKMKFVPHEYNICF